MRARASEHGLGFVRAMGEYALARACGLGCACACARGTVATPLPFHELALGPPAVGPGVDVGVKSAVKRAVKRVVEREVDSADDCRSESTRPSQLVKWSAGLLTGWCA